MVSRPRYTDAGQLLLGYSSKQITAPLMLDNDSACVVVHDKDWTPGETETVFEMHPEDLLEQLLTLCGIPWEHV
jgi:hypothetical protein